MTASLPIITREERYNVSDLADRVISQEFFLSPRTKVLIFFDGDTPDVACFKNLRAFIDLMESSIVGSATKGARKKKALGPCLKHPNAPRKNGPRRGCTECLKEHARLMVEARRQKAS